MNSPSVLDALIVVPPLSPSDTNPPLGPYLLRTCFERARLSLAVCDLSISYIRSFGASAANHRLPILGDRDKDRTLISMAKRQFLEVSPLTTVRPVALPCCSNPITGMHFSFEDVEAAVRSATDAGRFWSGFIERHVFAVRTAPRVLGLSIMGPPQVFLALVVARMAKQRWPDTIVIAGGSHITLLMANIAADPRYGAGIDAFMAGHCEREFVSLCQTLRAGGSWRGSRGVVVAGSKDEASGCSQSSAVTQLTINSEMRQQSIELVPTFDSTDLEPFARDRVTIPLQLARGCVYGRCTMCTYPATEPGFSGYPHWPAVGDAIETLLVRHRIPRFSFKDSFMVPKMLRALTDVLNDRSLQVEWSATTMLNDRLTPHLLRDMAAAGCRTLEFGLETTWPAGQELFDKDQPIQLVERIIGDTATAGIVANINLIYGLPGESLDQARAQLRWFLDQQDLYPGLITGSHNMLEINRASPLARDGSKLGVEIAGIAPWAFSYAWNAPGWRPEFALELERTIQPTLPTPQIVTLPRSTGAPIQT